MLTKNKDGKGNRMNTSVHGKLRIQLAKNNKYRRACRTMSLELKLAFKSQQGGRTLVGTSRPRKLNTGFQSC